PHLQGQGVEGVEGLSRRDVPQVAGGGTLYQRPDGTWAAPAGSHPATGEQRLPRGRARFVATCPCSPRNTAGRPPTGADGGPPFSRVTPLVGGGGESLHAIKPAARSPHRKPAPPQLRRQV